MENAGKIIEDENIAAHLRERGLGTPATRADVIENLITKGYANRQGRAIRPAVKGIRLIDTLRRVHIDRLSSAKLTGEIEKHLAEVEAGERTAADFITEIEDYAKEIVHIAKTFEYGDLYKDEPALGACPSCGRPVIEMAWFYRCEEQEGVEREDDCPMRFWKDTSGRYLDRGAVTALIRDGRTPILDGFTARNGRTYKGTIELDTDEWKLKVQSEGWNEDGGYQLPEYDVDPAPLGPCPSSADCTVIETPTQFLCTTRLAADETQAAYKEARKLAKEKGEKAPPKPEKPEHAGLVFPRTVCKREITREEAQVYVRMGKTELLSDFTSRFGRPFAATLVLKKNGRHGFEFQPRERRSGASAGRKKATRKKKSATRKKTTRKKAPRKKKAATGKKTTRKKASRKTSSTRKKAPAKKTTPLEKSAARTRGDG
jgi:DNA topoisomerase-3